MCPLLSRGLFPCSWVPFVYLASAISFCLSLKLGSTVFPPSPPLLLPPPSLDPDLFHVPSSSSSLIWVSFCFTPFLFTSNLWSSLLLLLFSALAIAQMWCASKASFFGLRNFGSRVSYPLCMRFISGVEACYCLRYSLLTLATISEQ
jgi:hypothetical protein